MKKLFTILLLSVGTTLMSQKIDIKVNLPNLSDSIYYKNNDSFVTSKYNIIYVVKKDTLSYMTCIVSYQGDSLGVIYGGLSSRYLKTLYPILLETIYDRKGIRK